MSNYERILAEIGRRMERTPADPALYRDAGSAVRAWGSEAKTGKWDLPRAVVDANHRLLNSIAQGMRRADGEKAVAALYEEYRRCLFFTAPYWFDDYLQAVEFDRKPEKKFYLPRRGYLKPIVAGYQQILDGELHFLSVSLPKRGGKSQIGINFISLLSGREPEKSTLMEGTGDALVKSFYNGCLEYMQDRETYRYFEIFPEARLVQTNADMKTINLNTRSRFPTIMCRSIDSTQVGLSEATNVLYLDDCVEGREEAKNRPRLDAKWEIISGDILGRAIEGTPIIITGTRYSLYDPIGHMQEEAKKAGWAWRSIEIPALDPVTDESNYEYLREGKKVFTTGYFREQRELLSAEQFESEFQQQPFEAKGLLFNRDSLNYYINLPAEVEPDTVLAVCDTAEQGSDSTALVILKIYGSDVFVDDVVFDSAPPEVTKPECAKAIHRHRCAVAEFESNNAGTYYCRDVEALVTQMGGRTAFRARRTVTNKRTRIEMASDNILKHFWFRDASAYERGGQYWDFMKELTSYTRSGKVPHDDAPDVLSLAEHIIRNLAGGKVEIVQRIF